MRFDGARVLIRDSKYLRDPANAPEQQPIDMIHLYGVNPTIHYFEDKEPFRLVSDQNPRVTSDIFLTS